MHRWAWLGWEVCYYKRKGSAIYSEWDPTLASSAMGEDGVPMFIVTGQDSNSITACGFMTPTQKGPTTVSVDEASSSGSFPPLGMDHKVLEEEFQMGLVSSITVNHSQTPTSAIHRTG